MWPEDDIDPISFAADRCDECGIDPDEVRTDLLREVLAVVDHHLRDINNARRPDLPANISGRIDIAIKCIELMREDMAALSPASKAL